jgi:hypothetical protein
MWMMVAGAAFLAACTAEVDANKEAQSEQSVLTADDQTPDESVAPAKSSADEVTPRVACRKVTASSIPVFTAPGSNSVRCRFLAGDKFSYFGAVQAPGFPQRLVTWCPRGVKPSDGTTSYAQLAGTVDGGCTN